MRSKPYIPFTEEQKRQAANTDLEVWLQRRGEKLIASGKDKRLASDHSVTVRGHRWYDHAAEQGGNAISFLQRQYNMSFQDAMTELLGNAPVTRVETYPSPQREEREQKPFVLPPANADMHRVFAYLIKQRHIDRDVLSAFAREGLIYEDAEHHNAVFVGKDESGKPRHAHMRSTNSFAPPFRLNVEGGDPQYSFHHIGTDGSLFVFEAPIDLLSYLTLCPTDWEESSYVACCGTSIQPVLKMLERMTQADTAYLCLDNDKAGHKAAERMTEELEAHGLKIVRLTPELKDWNEDLVNEHHVQEVEQCQIYGQ